MRHVAICFQKHEKAQESITSADNDGEDDWQEMLVLVQESNKASKPGKRPQNKNATPLLMRP
jgi:hypothetical protein